MRIARPWLAIALAAVVQSTAGCFHNTGQSSFGASPAREWPEVLSNARRDQIESRFDSADSTYARFARQYPGTIEALETAYWRALLKMDPANPHASLSSAAASLDGYMADSRPHEHGAEAATLRRLISQLDGLNKVAAGSIAPSGAARTATAPISMDANEAEIKRLKDELAKANAELDRIRKRLATPPPGKP